MQIIKADRLHKNQVLKTLDNFRTAISTIIEPDKNLTYTTAQELGGELFDKIINSPDSVIFLAIENSNCVGLISVHKIPQIRKGSYCGEVEDMFVEQEFQGKGVAQLLMNAAEAWAKQENLSNIRLESGNELARAHAFYQKCGLINYGKAFRKKLN